MVNGCANFCDPLVGGQRVKTAAEQADLDLPLVKSKLASERFRTGLVAVAVILVVAALAAAALQFGGDAFVGRILQAVQGRALFPVTLGLIGASAVVIVATAAHGIAQHARSIVPTPASSKGSTLVEDLE